MTGTSSDEILGIQPTTGTLGVDVTVIRVKTGILTHTVPIVTVMTGTSGDLSTDIQRITGTSPPRGTILDRRMAHSSAEVPIVDPMTGTSGDSRTVQSLAATRNPASHC